MYLYTVNGCLPVITVDFSSCDKDHMVCKAENIYYMDLYRKCLLTPKLDLPSCLLTKMVK